MCQRCSLVKKPIGSRSPHRTSAEISFSAPTSPAPKPKFSRGFRAHPKAVTLSHIVACHAASPKSAKHHNPIPSRLHQVSYYDMIVFKLLNLHSGTGFQRSTYATHKITQYEFLSTLMNQTDSEFSWSDQTDQETCWS